jgi:uncharacterized protein Usg
VVEQLRFCERRLCFFGLTEGHHYPLPPSPAFLKMFITKDLTMAPKISVFNILLQNIEMKGVVRT